MPIVAPTTALVAESYDLLVGVDTHAASHTYAIVDAATGALVEHRAFPTSPAGLRRAQNWINRRTDSGTVLVLVDGAGSYGAVLTEQLLAAGADLAEAPDITRQVRHTSGKSDIIDAAELARAARGPQTSRLRRPRQGGDRTILRVLSSARDQMTGERTRTINALTAMLRTVDLGIDARRALSAGRWPRPRASRSPRRRAGSRARRSPSWRSRTGTCSSAAARGAWCTGRGRPTVPSPRPRGGTTTQVTPCGCLGPCNLGPLVVDGPTWHRAVTAEDAAALVALTSGA